MAQPQTQGWKLPDSIGGATTLGRPSGESPADKLRNLHLHPPQEEPQGPQGPQEPDRPEKEIPQDFITPDKIWNANPEITFFYGDLNGKRKFIDDDGSSTHWAMLSSYMPGLGGVEIRRKSIENGLIGRIGEWRGHYVISFWNDNRANIDKYMGDLIKELKSRKYPYYSKSLIVSTIFGNKPIQEYEKLERQTRYSPEEVSSMQKRMHNAAPEEKKAIRKALGLYRYGRTEKEKKKLAWKQAAGLWPEHLLNFREWING